MCVYIYDSVKDHKHLHTGRAPEGLRIAVGLLWLLLCLPMAFPFSVLVLVICGAPMLGTLQISNTNTILLKAKGRHYVYYTPHHYVWIY